MTPYKALWKVNIPGRGTEYREVTVVTAPVYGHVKCADRKAVPVVELVGVDGDGYAVITQGGRSFLSVAGRW